MPPLGSEPHLTFVRWLLVWFWQKGSITDRTTDNRQRETCPFLSTGHPVTLHSATAHHLGTCKWDSGFLYLFKPTKLASLYPSEIPEDCLAPSPQQCGSQLCDTSLPKTSSNHFLVSLLCCWVQLLSCLTLCDPMNWSTEGPLSSTISQSLLKLMFIELVMPSNHPILCHPLLLLTSIFPSIRVFSNESVLCIRWPKYWSFSFSPSKEYSGSISFKIDWFDPTVQRTLKSLLQHHS